MDKMGSCTIVIILMVLPGKTYQAQYVREFNCYCMHIHSDAFSLSAMCAGQPYNPIILSAQNGSALTSPVVFGINQTVSIWCRANTTDDTGKLLGHFWLYNGTRLPKPERGQLTDHDVYRERFHGIVGVDTPVSWAVLHISRIQPSYAGVYICVANYMGVFKNQSVEVNVSGEWVLIAFN